MLELQVGSGHPGVGFFQALQFSGLKSWLFFIWQGFQPEQACREAASAPSPISPALLLLPCRAGQTQD